MLIVRAQILKVTTLYHRLSGMSQPARFKPRHRYAVVKRMNDMVMIWRTRIRRKAPVSFVVREDIVLPQLYLWV